jgi:hypothetical protein
VKKVDAATKAKRDSVMSVRAEKRAELKQAGAATKTEANKVGTATKTEVKKVDAATKKAYAAKRDSIVAKRAEANGQAVTAGEHLKKDGTLDKRYKENKVTATQHLKKDGTPDKRFRENKKDSIK